MEAGAIKKNAARLNELATQQLVRYEALFKLIDNVHVLEDIALISKHVARQWKYFANVGSFRLTVFKDGGYQVIDGFRGEAHIASVTHLSAWDRYHCRLKRPRLLRLDEPMQGPPPPDHLAGKAIAEIQVLPFMRGTRWIALLTTAARHEPFSDLDNKFVRIFGSHFADRVSDSLFRRQATETLVEKASRDGSPSETGRQRTLPLQGQRTKPGNAERSPLIRIPLAASTHPFVQRIPMEASLAEKICV